MGRTLALTAIVLGVVVLAHRSDAADISRSEPDFLLPCDEVFEDGRIAPGYVEMIADFAIPRQPQVSEAEALGAEPAVPDRLSKWPGKMRMVVRSDIAMSRSAFTYLRLYSSGWSEFDIEYVWNNHEESAKFMIGPVLVHVHQLVASMQNAKTDNSKLDAMLVEFYVFRGGGVEGERSEAARSRMVWICRRHPRPESWSEARHRGVGRRVLPLGPWELAA